MPQIINTNIASMTAQRNLNSSQDANTTAMERLSSGLRINSAKDDAAGLAISTRFESQTRGLGVAIRNAGDGISLAQTAEGALGSMTDNMQRIRELAVQSSNESNSEEDRIALQNEVDQRLAELRRTAEETNFNGRQLLDGSFNGTFQIGANAGESVDVQISELTVDRLGSDKQSGVSAAGTDDALANGDLVINGASVDSSVIADDSYSTEFNAASGIAKAAAINRVSDDSGVTAYANSNVVSGAAMVTGAATEAVINLNGVDITLQSTTNETDSDKAETRDSVISAINAVADQTGVTASDAGKEGGVILTAEDGRNIVMYSNDGSGTALANGSTGTELFGLANIGTTADTAPSLASVEGAYEGGFTLVAEGDTKSIEVTGGYGVGSGDLDSSGLSRGTYDRAIASYTNQAVTAGSTSLTEALTAITTASTAGTSVAEAFAIQEGDLTINGVSIGASYSNDDTASDDTALMSDASASGIAIAAAINRASESTEVTAEVNETTMVGVTATTAQDITAGNISATAGATMAVYINNVDIGSVVSQGDSDKDRQSTMDLINAKAGQTGVRAEENGEGLTLIAEDGRNISVGTYTSAAGSDTAAFGLDQNVEGIGITSGGLAEFATTAETTYSTVRLESADSIEVEAGSGGAKGLDDSGFSAGVYGNGEDGQFLKDLDITTFDGAQAAITAVDNALGTVNSQRAELGAMQNRFESTVTNLQVAQENLTQANSRIRDADFAAETAEMARTQVLQQAGISVLAQANQRPQQALSLLG